MSRRKLRIATPPEEQPTLPRFTVAPVLLPNVAAPIGYTVYDCALGFFMSGTTTESKIYLDENDACAVADMWNDLTAVCQQGLVSVEQKAPSLADIRAKEEAAATYQGLFDREVAA